MEILLVDKPIKAVVDVEANVMAIGGGLHVDEESFLLGTRI